MGIVQGQSGNTLTEYGFVGGLVLVGLLVTVTLLGDNLASALQGLRGDMSHSRNAAVIAAEAQANDGRYVLTPDLLTYETVCIAPGQCLQMPVVPDTPFLATAGANGSDMTRVFANVLSDLAALLEADPNTDPVLLAKVKELAAKGHELGDIQENIAGSEYKDEYQKKKKGLFGLFGSENVKVADAEDKLKDDLHELKNGPAEEFKQLKNEVEALLRSSDSPLSEQAEKLIKQESEQIVQIVDGIDPETATVEGTAPVLDSTGEITHQSADEICGTATTASCRS